MGFKTLNLINPATVQALGFGIRWPTLEPQFVPFTASPTSNKGTSKTGHNRKTLVCLSRAGPLITRKVGFLPEGNLHP